MGGLFFVNFIGRFIFAPLMPIIENEMRFSHGQAGFIFLTLSAGFVAAQLVSGFVASRLHHRGTMIVSGLGVSLSLLAFGATSSIGSKKGPAGDHALEKTLKRFLNLD